MRTEKQKMLAGEAYRPGDPELRMDAQRAREWMVRYNATLAASPAERRVMLRELFASVGEDAVVRPPFHCDYGQHISIGDGAFLNFNCVILDVAPVAIGALTQVGPGVQFLTADHPRDPALRRAGSKVDGQSPSGQTSGLAVAH
ncbi:acetyltransferase-like isoleucine patch superfamily enzyme [Methylobacterium sp. PvR107]|nr:acetyltransferase-like isoleucine patch superfamily enzyme [Methylobacterium sp. PvR107]